MNNCEQIVKNVLSESFLHLPLRPIFRQLHPNFRGGHTAGVSSIYLAANTAFGVVCFSSESIKV